MREALSLELVLTMYNQKIVTFLSIRQINGQISSSTCADQDIFPSGEGYLRDNFIFRWTGVDASEA